MNKRFLYKEGIIKKLGNGFESDVYLYNDSGKDVVLKLFRECPSLDNKELKLILLNEKKELLNNFRLIHRIYDRNNKFIGYTLPYEPSETLNNYICKSKKTKINILNMLQEKYQELNENDIFIGDYNYTNFGIKDNKLILYDVDNYSIDGYDFDIKDNFMNDYFKRANKNDNIDYYCFNLFTLSFMTRIIPEAIIRQMRINGLPKEFRNEDCKNIYRSLFKINDDFIKEKLDNGDDITLIKCMKKGLFK